MRTWDDLQAWLRHDRPYPEANNQTSQSTLSAPLSAKNGGTQSTATSNAEVAI
jgi:hypothetical protein